MFSTAAPSKRKHNNAEERKIFRCMDRIRHRSGYVQNYLQYVNLIRLSVIHYVFSKLTYAAVKFQSRKIQTRKINGDFSWHLK
jgi:hypothetical protein